MFYTNGPFKIIANHQIVPNEYSWNINHNVIYIDSPVGTGYSFTDSNHGYMTNAKDVGDNLLIALQQFFLLFPMLQENEFFVAGEFYGGKFVAALAYAIHQHNEREISNANAKKINLKGLAIGNGWIDPVHQLNYADYLYQLGFIDSNGHSQFIQSQNQAIDCIQRRDFQCAFDIFDQILIGNISPYSSLYTNLTGFKSLCYFLNTEDEEIPAMKELAERFEIRRAIHVGNNSFNLKNSVDSHFQLDFMDSVADWVAELLSYYPILIYNGQFDVCVPFVLTENYLQSLEFNSAEQYKSAERHIWHVGNEAAGYFKCAGNLTVILVRNAG